MRGGHCRLRPLAFAAVVLALLTGSAGLEVQVLLGHAAQSVPGPALSSAPAVVEPASAAEALRSHARQVDHNRSDATGTIEAQGGHLVLDGHPWRFVGYNDFRLASRSLAGYTCGGEHPDQEVDAELSRIAADGATVVRTWFFQSYVASGDWTPFDRILVLAGRHHLRVLPVLTNQYGTCEEYHQTADVYKTLDWYRTGYRTRRDNDMPLTYRDYAVAVARRYAGDPRIAFWQLVNEAIPSTADGGCDEAAGAAALRAFADDVTRAVQRADPDHMVSLGTLDTDHCGSRGRDYGYVHAGAIDICEIHEYAPQPRSSPPPNPCARLAKPFFVGERGFAAFPGSAGSGVRSALFASDLSALVRSDCAGYVIWEMTAQPSGGYAIGPEDPVHEVVRSAAATLASTQQPGAG